MIFSVAIGITGIYTFHLNPHLPVADQALPWLVMNVLPPWLARLGGGSDGFRHVLGGQWHACPPPPARFLCATFYPLVTGHYPKRPVVLVRRALALMHLLFPPRWLFTRQTSGWLRGHFFAPDDEWLGGDHPAGSFFGNARPGKALWAH